MGSCRPDFSGQHSWPGRPPAYSTARQLLKKSLVHVIATDAHSSVNRPPRLSKAVAAAARIVGEERANQMVSEIPLAVLNGTGFPSLEAAEPPEMVGSGSCSDRLGEPSGGVWKRSDRLVHACINTVA